MSKALGRTLSLAELLTSNSKEELLRIRRVFNIQGASQMNKSELVHRISSYMIEHLEQHLSRMDPDRYNLLLKVMKSPNSVLPISEVEDILNFEPVYFQQYGLIFLLREEIVMPEEIRDRLLEIDSKQLQTVLKRNKEWIQLTQGLLFYYGNMNAPQLIARIELFTGQNIDHLEYWNVISQLEQYDYSVLTNEFGFSHFTVLDPKLIDEETRSRPTLDYYPVTKAQALLAADEDYVDRNAAYRQFVAYLVKRWDIEKDIADAITADLIDRIQHGDSPSELIEGLQEELELEDIEQTQQLVDLMFPLMNKTRLWALKGFSPDEIIEEKKKHSKTPPMYPFANIAVDAIPPTSQVRGASPAIYDFQTKKKFGRNDPCPCGSGKKFKKCCGTT